MDSLVSEGKIICFTAFQRRWNCLCVQADENVYNLVVLFAGNLWTHRTLKRGDDIRDFLVMPYSDLIIYGNWDDCLEGEINYTESHKNDI